VKKRLLKPVAPLSIYVGDWLANILAFGYRSRSCSNQERSFELSYNHCWTICWLP